MDASKNAKLNYLDCRGNSALSSICVFDTNYAITNPKFKKDPSQSWTQNCFLTSIDNSNTNTSSINIFPNPAKEELNITGDIKEVKFYNSNGVNVLNGTSNNYSLTNFPKGIYQVQVTLTDGRIQNRKFVKE